MREICPSCGKDMVVTTETFEINGDAVCGIPHLLCRSCGEATFTAEQLDMVFGYRTAQKQRSMKTEDSRTLDATDAAEIRFLVDAETLGWLERESARTGISLEKVASAMLRKACNETPALGAPGATVSAGRAETAEVRCDARRRSAMKDTCPYCEAGMIETDEAFSLDGPNGPITITGVHHNKCPECGEITFGPKHLDEMHEFKLSHRSMFP